MRQSSNPSHYSEQRDPQHHADELSNTKKPYICPSLPSTALRPLKLAQGESRHTNVCAALLAHSPGGFSSSQLVQGFTPYEAHAH